MLPTDGIAYRIVLERYDTSTGTLRKGYFLQQQSETDFNWKDVRECVSEMEALACAVYMRSQNPRMFVPIYSPSGYSSRS